MKQPLDRFSLQAEAYKKHRPIYPRALYDEILKHVSVKEKCWDCGTGSGQVAEALASHFQQVEATDISENQLAQAPKRSNVNYTVQRTENTNFLDNQFDLITVGQAVHWFDFEAFTTEVRRVAKPEAIVAIWGYGLLKVDAAVDKLTTDFDANVVGPFWDVERRHIDAGYATIPFDFEQIKMNEKLSIETFWNTDQLEGYFNSWSCVQNYKQQHNGENPVPALMEELYNHWPKDETKRVIFPIFLKVGRIEK